MRILHVLSQFEVTGAEVYALTLMEEQQKNGHTIYVTSDTLSRPHLYNYFACNIGNRKYLNRIKVYKILRDFVREKKIDLIHAHSRAASWVCFWVSLRLKIPLISTVHGLQHIHFSSKLFSIYGDQIIAICEAITSQIKNKLNLKTGICTIRNGLNMDNFRPEKYCNISRESDKLIITYIGRLTGPKGEFLFWFIEKVFSAFYEKYPNSKLIVIGGNIVPREFPDLIDSFNKKNGSQAIEHLVFQDDICPYIMESDICIGSGRVAMEVMAMNKPVLAVGESCYIGPVNNKNLDRAIFTNFGDCAEKEEKNINVVLNDLIKFADNRDEYFAQSSCYRRIIEKKYNVIEIAKDIEKIYKEKISQKKTSIKNISVLMYHKVINNLIEKPKHQIYVTDYEFEEQIKYLLEKGFTSITFKDLADYYDKGIPIPDKPVIITFDDGYKNNYDIAFQTAKKYKIKFVVFAIGKPAIVNFWDEEDKNISAELLNPNEIKEMSEYGIEFGSHTVNHKKLASLESKEMEYELSESKKYLEEITGCEVQSIAYPYGDVNEEVKTIVRETGYRFGIATITGPLDFFNDKYEIRRIPVFPGTDLISFGKKISKIYPMYKEFKNNFKKKI